MLCSILALLEYRHQVMEWEEKGVPFRSHAYVPEVHPLTKTDFHEREDEGREPRPTTSRFTPSGITSASLSKKTKHRKPNGRKVTVLVLSNSEFSVPTRRARNILISKQKVREIYT